MCFEAALLAITGASAVSAQVQRNRLGDPPKPQAPKPPPQAAKEPVDLSRLRRANSEAAVRAGIASTIKTGPTGVAPSSLIIGRNVALGG